MYTEELAVYFLCRRYNIISEASMAKTTSVGKKGVRGIKRLLLHYKIQNFVANLMMIAAIVIVLFGVYHISHTVYMISACTEKTEGYVERMENSLNPIMIQLEEKYPKLKKKYPVIRYETKNGKYIHQSKSSVNVSENTQFSAQVRYNPNHGEQAILSIEIFDQIGREGILLLLGILVFVNSRILHIPNLKTIQIPEGTDIDSIV